MIIYHLVRKNDWKKYRKNGVYTPSSLTKEGFIHCSTKEQVLATANRRFAGMKDLLLLVINTQKVSAKIVFEDLRGIGEKHPHIYGKLPVRAVRQVLPLFPNSDSSFTKLPVRVTAFAPYVTMF